MKCNLLAITGLLLAAAALPGPAAAADAYKIDNIHSAVIFRVKHLNVSYFYGRFNEIGGSFTFDEADPTTLALNVEIKIESVDTNDKKRDDHLKGPDFFHARQYRTSTFKSTKVEPGKDGGYRVTGDFTLHGVTKPITVDLEFVGARDDPWGGYRAGFDTTFTIKRSDFGMDYMVGGLGDDIRIMVGFEGVRQQPGG